MFSALQVNVFADAGIIYAIGASNLAGKIILVILLIGSLFTWSVIFSKIAAVRRIRRETARFLRKFRGEAKGLDLYFDPRARYVCPSYHVYRAGCRELLFQLTGNADAKTDDLAMLTKAEKLSPAAMNAVRAAVEREVGEQALRLEDRMILLATATSGAPFLGLLGTVWGVMDTFASVAAQGKADLTIMAPGVAGALVTTVTGLLVAIPAMFGYNFLVTTIRALTVELDNFASELVTSFEHRYLDTSSR
ncbi:MAG: MotA/TolQ/ExbB proton channel family protein [Verrucomicrobiota bacterium]